MDLRKLDAALKKVEKPARYIGGELGAVVKDPDQVKVRFAFAFPDLYEIGMSHLGLQILYGILNDQEDIACERVFAPWFDMEEQMRTLGIPLYSLETKTPIKDFDFLGFTLQYELSFTNILNMLDLAGLEVYAKDRKEGPIVVAGGPVAYTPEPLADFIDLFILGEGEEVNLELIRLYQKIKDQGGTKDDFLLAAGKIKGIYVPKFYREVYKEDGTISHREVLADLPEVIEKRKVEQVDQMAQNRKQIVPFIETVHDRVVLEMFRGCTHGCRFCQAGMIYRPIREKSKENLLDQARRLIDQTGYREISLSSLSSCDYRDLLPLIQDLMEEFKDQRVALSLPSLRLDTFFVDVLKEIEKVKKTGLTFAPEAGSQRLRDVINKNVSQEDLLAVCQDVFKEGWSKIKLYFMIGLPTEEEEDLLGILQLAEMVKDAFFNRPKEEIKGNFTVTASASCFVPKAFTPFQWFGQNTKEDFLQKAYFIKERVKDPKIRFRYHDPATSVCEAVLARGDRRTGKLLYRLFELGARFDGWTDGFKEDLWIQAMEDTGISPDFYAYRERPLDEVLPWDFIDIGVTKAYLKKEYQKALQGQTTLDCRKGCHGCGIKNCSMWEDFHAGTC